MITLIIFIILYLLSVWYNFVTIQKLFFHPHGFRYGDKCTSPAIWFCFLPPLNFVSNILFLINGWKDDRYESDKSIFFTKKYNHLKE